ncbi:MAG: flagellar P-ring protein [Phycisphaerae bacterium]|nr:MAG: flagellar P-ring protein [Phycisphaerae bacterium]
MRNQALACLVLLMCVALSGVARAGTVRDLVRFKGQGESLLQGYGLVIGLENTGDSAKEAALALPLAKVLEHNGVNLGTPRVTDPKSKSVAMVLVTCTVPPAGARADDKLDVWVSTIGSATSLAGGQLFITALKGPRPGDPTVWAVAEGTLELEGTSKTRAKVRGGARMVEDILMPEVGDEFDLIIDQPFAGWASATQIAVAINARAMPGGPAVAKAIDERTVRVTIPPAERGDKAGFLADVLSADVTLGELDLPATIIYNAKRGSIIVDGDVAIGPVAITHANLAVTTLMPQPQATAQNPRVETERWATMAPGARASEKARLSDLMAAFKALDIPTTEQIAVLEMLHKMGKLQAKMIVD